MIITKIQAAGGGTIEGRLYLAEATGASLLTLASENTLSTWTLNLAGVIALRGLCDEYLLSLCDDDSDEAKPLDPLTYPGWYEMDDRTWTEFTLMNGRLVGGRVVASRSELEELKAEDAHPGDLTAAPEMGPLVLGGRLHPDPEAVLEDEDIDPVGDADTATMLRSKTHECWVEAVQDLKKGPVYRFHYRCVTKGHMVDQTGLWGQERHTAINHMRAMILDGLVAVKS